MTSASSKTASSKIIGTFKTPWLWQIRCMLVVVVATSQQSSGARGLELPLIALADKAAFRRIVSAATCHRHLSTSYHCKHAWILKMVTTRLWFYSKHTYVELSAYGWTRPVYQHPSTAQTAHKCCTSLEFFTLHLFAHSLESFISIIYLNTQNLVLKLSDPN